MTPKDDHGTPVGGLLNRPTLVLNRSWLPVNVTPVRRALGLVYRGTASIVHTSTYEVFDLSSWVERNQNGCPSILAVRFKIPLPEVIVLSRFDKVIRRHLPFSRRNLYRRDRLRCQYCGGRPGTRLLTIDHVVPRTLGGRTSWTNCVLACATCNSKKGGRTPEQVGMSLLQKPVRPEWATAVGPSVPSLKAFLHSRTGNGAVGESEGPALPHQGPNGKLSGLP